MQVKGPQCKKSIKHWILVKVIHPKPTETETETEAKDTNNKRVSNRWRLKGKTQNPKTNQISSFICHDSFFRA